MTKRVGRKSKLTEEEVRKVILMFRENVQAMGNISYSEIHRYANELHEQGVISASTSDAFWRKEGRLGRIEVEKANEIFSETVTVSNGKEVKVPNVVDLVNKRYKDKDDLLKHLLFMEKQFHESLDREKKLQKDLSKLQESHNELKDNLKKEKESKDKLQGVVYRLYRTLMGHANEEVNQKVDYAMKTAFKEPTAFLEGFKEKEEVQEGPKVLPIDKKPVKSSFASKFRK
ncbi:MULTISPECIES: hypothetical protein [Bacillus cereus group]|uniref:hypothetical protein n=1 Tax=Bacillus cereus group TaxID=86661 RepID=UPI001C969C3B|nr:MULTISPECIES: hypothetical protein [Bacillus cereus group]MBY5229869.1 hypothetical protein [Bacillus paranthracis]MCU5096541.1 hypothetical protein [Bacillus wiedmannii]MCY9250416.1 hypothetical protein [Bacillus paranthracis]MDA1945564.1 hypothetical protein [Bacillus cereus group sp. BcHK124]MDR4166799.1 hypothetical protein [Bacillus paranthracis]